MSEFAVIGAGMRHKYIYNELQNQLVTVEIFGNENLPDSGKIEDIVSSSEIIIAPIPFTRDGITLNLPFSDKVSIDDFFRMSADKTVFSVNIDAYTQKSAESETKVFDMNNDRSFIEKNALLTAEGTLKYIIESTPCGIYDSKAIIIGFGRIGKHLSRILSILGADVTVSARKSADWLTIKAYGYHAADTNALTVPIGCNYIINTVPHPIITASVIRNIEPQTVIVDIASGIGGTDFAAARIAGINAFQAPSIPSRCSPQSAATAVLDCVFSKLKEVTEYG